VVAVVELITSSHGGLSLREIGARLKIARSTLYTIVQELDRAGWVIRGGGGVSPGPALLRVASARNGSPGLWSSLQPILDRLRDETGETVQLCVLNGYRAEVVAKSDGKMPISVTAEVGARVPINWSAAGRLLIADLDDHVLTAQLRKIIKPSPSGKAPTSPNVVLAEIRKARRDGTAWQADRSALHTGAVAAAVRDSERRCLAAISIVVPKHRLDRQRRKLTEAVTKAARNASAALTGRAARVRPS
jgi:DNA-binding IclR family transcriptional regulator